MRVAVYPGTFDPITNGHMDVIRRAATHLCDRLVVSVAVNEGKNPLFNLEERLEICRKVVATYPDALSQKIEIVPFEGLLVDHVHAQGTNLVVRGLRAVSDFEYEFQMAMMNARVSDQIETMFLMAGETHQFISSRFVKEIHRLGGDISSCVHPLVLEALANQKE